MEKKFMLFVGFAYLAAVTSAANLIGCSEEDLMLALSTRKIQAGKDNIAKKLTLQQVCGPYFCIGTEASHACNMTWLYLVVCRQRTPEMP